MDYSLIEARPGNTVVLLPNPPDFTVVAASNDFIKNAQFSREKFIGSNFFTNFPKSPNDTDFTGEENVRASFAHALQYKVAHVVDMQRYDIVKPDGSFEEKYWQLCNAPVLSDTGEVRYLIHTSEDISEQIKVAEQAEQFQDIQRAYHLFMQAPVAVCIVKGAEYIVELANKDMLQLLGRTASMVGRRIEESLPEANLQGLISILDHVWNTGKTYQAHNFPAVLLIDGIREQRYFDLVFQPYFKNETDKEPTSIFCVAYNITRQIETQKQLEALQNESERQKRLYEAITGSTPDLLYVFDLNYRFAYANEALLAMWGKTMNDAVGKGFLENGYEPWHAQMHEREIDQVVATKQPIRGEVFFPHATLGRRVYDYIFVPVFNKEGEVEAIAGTTRDITEIKKAEQSIRESEERFRTLADESPMFVFIIDAAPEAPVNYWNKTWLQYTGQTLEEAKSRAWNGMIHDDDLKTVLEHYIPAFESKQPYFIQAVRIKRFDGVYRWHTFKGNPRYGADGVFNGYIGVGLDIHDQKLAEEALKQNELMLQQKVAERTAELQKAVDELKQLNANLEQFAYAASHDLKEPIRKIHIFSDRIKYELQGKLSESQNYLFGRLENTTTRMTNLVDDLLTYSQATNGVSQQEEVDLNKKLRLVLDDLELEVQQKEAKINIGVLPTITGNKRQIQQLFQNLITNALKYSKPGKTPEISIGSTIVKGNEVKAHISAEDNDKSFYLVEVQDNGVGFKQEDATRIFNVFTRLHGNTELKGTGVGLSIAQKVAENHGGTIWAESTPGEGSVFKILLPVA